VAALTVLAVVSAVVGATTNHGQQTHLVLVSPVYNPDGTLNPLPPGSVTSPAAKGLCGSVSAQPIQANEMVAVRIQTIKDGELSGDPTLYEGAIAYLNALQAHNGTAIVAANNRIAKECERLRIRTGIFKP
jgi:hypothetical protein